MGDAELSDPALEDRHTREASMARVGPIIEAFCMRHTKQELYLEVQARHLAVTPVNTPAEFVDSDHTKALGAGRAFCHAVWPRAQPS